MRGVVGLCFGICGEVGGDSFALVDKSILETWDGRLRGGRGVSWRRVLWCLG